MEPSTHPSLAEIFRARETQSGFIRRTPLLSLARTPQEGWIGDALPQAECLQVTGAYKPRGAFNVMLGLTPAERRCGVAITSSGNFAQAFAYAGHCMDVRVVVVMLERAAPVKIEATRSYGAEVILMGNDPLALRPAAVAIAGNEE